MGGPYQNVVDEAIVGQADPVASEGLVWVWCCSLTVLDLENCEASTTTNWLIMFKPLITVRFQSFEQL